MTVSSTRAGQGRRFEPGMVTREPVGQGKRALVIDNYDSFTYNLVQYLLELGCVVDVYRNDAITLEDIVQDHPTHVVLSPGPGRPSDSGVCQDVCRAFTHEVDIPLLGVCLGHQTLAAVHGAEVVVADRIMHGKLSTIEHNGSDLFDGLPSPFRATRYHSLIVRESTLPPSLVPTAHTPERELMAVRHASRSVYGVQFHPESILSEHGHALLANFLRAT